jgi:uncharacterized protein YjiK
MISHPAALRTPAHSWPFSWSPLRCILLGLLSATTWTAPAAAQESVLGSYDLSSGAGHRSKLPPALQEVSGLATTADGRLFGHNDERAILYEIVPATGQVPKAFAVGRSGVPGDFEGLAIVGERFFLLTSEGRLLEFREGEHGASVGYRAHSLELMNLCEAEGLAYDTTREALLVPCKTPRNSGFRGHLVVLSVPLSTLRVSGPPPVFISLGELDRLGLGDTFRPSAIEIHPGTGSILLLAGPEEALLELTAAGEIVGGEGLKSRDHPQPEGLAFLPDGRLVLADEGRGKEGTITWYGPGEGGGAPNP